ncbi:hypothetical protein PRZ48_007754 [Zasmidium cellare]|uniref:G domain-containing protein n=1 Tax=Zasmidium cellare TaxID=395010 RepID=A0ABR0EKL6_ZASCE|nr:hypothetical protein PRZ48_007754 [Zasmidium cellare]
MGVTGAGKSTFINYLSEFDVKVGNGLESCTEKVAIYPATLPGGKRVYLMDTPGFDDTFKTDTDILRKIASWLNEAYSNRLQLTGIVYLHRIQDNRVTGAAMKNLRMFKKLCGNDGLANNMVTPEVGLDREMQLRTHKDFWKPMLDNGSEIFRHDQEAASALAIIQHLLSKKYRVTLAIQRDMVDKKMTLEQTAAGREVEAELLKLRAKWAEEKKQLEREWREALETRDKEAQEQIRRERQEIEEKFKESDSHVERLKTNNSELAKQLERQRDEFARTQRLFKYLEGKQERREGKFYRRWNPWHVRYDEKAW